MLISWHKWCKTILQRFLISRWDQKVQRRPEDWLFSGSSTLTLQPLHALWIQHRPQTPTYASTWAELHVPALTPAATTKQLSAGFRSLQPSPPRVGLSTGSYSTMCPLENIQKKPCELWWCFTLAFRPQSSVTPGSHQIWPGLNPLIPQHQTARDLCSP